MGGFGSGRPRSTRRVAESLRRIDLASIPLTDLLSAGRASVITWSSRGSSTGQIGALGASDHVRLIYRAEDRSGFCEEVDEKIAVVWTGAGFGGKRPWLLCPRCSRRCRILFGTLRFRCRICQTVRYASQSETKADRATRAMFKIVHRLDPAAEMNFLPPKPKGMHWRTYERWAERYAFHDDRWSEETMRRFGFRS